MLVKAAAAAQIVPHMPVNGLVADGKQLVPAQMSRHLFRTPLFADHAFHALQIPGSESLIAT
jgi:hypothetical protein